MSITNTCIKPCLNCDGGKCTPKYLVKEALTDLEAWQQDPGNVKLAERFASVYGHIIPTKWLYGYSDEYQFSVDFKSDSTATVSTVSMGLDAAIKASGWGAKASANTKLDMETNYSAATKGSKSFLSTSRITQGPYKCGNVGVSECLSLFQEDIRGLSLIKVDNRVSVAQVLTPNVETVKKMTKALARGSAPCTSVYTTDSSGKPVFPGFVDRAENAYVVVTRQANNSKYVFQVPPSKLAYAEWTGLLDLPISSTFRFFLV